MSILSHSFTRSRSLVCQVFLRLRVVYCYLRDGGAGETLERAWKSSPASRRDAKGKREFTRVFACFACSTIPEGNKKLLVVYIFLFLCFGLLLRSFRNRNWFQKNVPSIAEQSPKNAPPERDFHRRKSTYSVCLCYFAQSKHRFHPLPPGWFYNGSHYVSLTGDKDFNHPRILCVWSWWVK